MKRGKAPSEGWSPVPLLPTVKPAVAAAAIAKKWLHERYDLSEHGVDTQRIARLLPIAQDMGVSPAQFAIAWCLKNPHVSTVMLGATRREQLEENLGALDAVDKLDADVMQRVDAALA